MENERLRDEEYLDMIKKYRAQNNRKSPAVDIKSTPNCYFFYFDVPGFDNSNIQVEVEAWKTLVIKRKDMEKIENEEAKERKFLKVERIREGHNMLRKFQLPHDADTDASAITAKCEDGVLTITVRKLPQPVHPKIVNIVVS